MTPALQRAAAALEAPFAIGALAVVVFAIWIAKDARYAPATWYTGGVFLAALAIVVFVTYDRVSVSRPAMAALVLLGAFAGWSALSIACSSDRGPLRLLARVDAHFSYPYGKTSESLAEIVAAAGFDTACSSEPGTNGLAVPLHNLRVEVFGTWPLARFRGRNLAHSAPVQAPPAVLQLVTADTGSWTPGLEPMEG